ncbi:MAG: ATP-binding protein [Ilumatobacteraceae bacterium]
MTTSAGGRNGDVAPVPVQPLGDRDELIPLLSALALGSLMTLVVAVDRRFQFAYLNPEGRIAVETTAALVSLFVGVLAYGRFRASRSVGDLGVTLAVFVLGFASIAFGAIPRAMSGSDPEAFSTWSSIVARFVGAAMLAASPFLVGRRASHRASQQLTRVVVTVILVIAAGAALLATHLPDGVKIALPLESADRPQVEKAVVVVVAQLVTGALFAIATWGFTRRAMRDPTDVFAQWMAAGAALQMFARLHFALFPSVYSDWLYTGDLLRLLGAVAWLVGALWELGRYWRDREALAVLDERRRMARELHDGLLQELSFIHSQSSVAAMPGEETMSNVAAAAERALREARLAVEALAGSTEMPPEVALRRAAEQFAVPAGIEVTCSFQPGCRVDSPLRHELARIVREASANAVKHAGATTIAVELDGAPDGSLWLMIADDGDGFDVEQGREGGFGLTSMRERAERIGAELTITSVRGQGTIVELMVPPGATDG